MNSLKCISAVTGLAALLCTMIACQPPPENQPRAVEKGSQQQTVLAAKSQQQEAASQDSMACPAKGTVVTLRSDTSSRTVSEQKGITYELDPDIGLGIAEPLWRGDLNEDGISDLVLIFAQACSNWGECPKGVYAGCSSPDKYVNVYEPDYMISLEVRDSLSIRSGGRWRDLFKVVRRDRFSSENSLLTFYDNSYHEAREE